MILPNPPSEDSGADASAEQSAQEWLERQDVRPSPAFRERGRGVVQNALHARVLRRRAVSLIVSGWMALAFAAVLVLTDG